MTTLGSCVALQFRVAVVPLMTRWSTGGTEMTVLPVKHPTQKQRKNDRQKLSYSTGFVNTCPDPKRQHEDTNTHFPLQHELLYTQK